MFGWFKYAWTSTHESSHYYLMSSESLAWWRVIPCTLLPL